MQPTRIEFDLRGIASKLKDRILSVPIYQRSYAWTLQEISEYWEDLKQAFLDNSAEYFIGTIVLTHQTNPPRTNIIDGQQRLATTSILLTAIRDEFKSKSDEKRAQIIHNNYLSTSELSSATDISKLHMNSEDAIFFEKRIINSDTSVSPTKPSHSLMINAYDHFLNEIRKLSSSVTDWASKLTNLVDFLNESVKAIFLEVPSDADAYLIFETLNDRGASLTVADLLKNYLFGHAGSKLDAVRDGWMQVLGILEISAETTLFTTFLRHYWSSIYGAVRERDLYRSIKSYVVTEDQVCNFIVGLQSASAIYAALLSSNHEYWQDMGGTTKENVETLLRLDLEQNRPLLLAALQHFIEKEKKTLLKSLISWSVRGLICGGLGGGLAERNYCNAAMKIRKGEIKTTKDVLMEISSIVPSDQTFKEAFINAKVATSTLARYYLAAMERYKQKEPEPEFVPNSNEDQVNLEHILPKRANASDWGSYFNTDERKDFLNRIGNLALLQKGPNDRIGNKPFSIKKQILKKSSFKLTSEVGKESDWTKDTIIKRQKSLAEIAIQVWPRK